MNVSDPSAGAGEVLPAVALEHERESCFRVRDAWLQLRIRVPPERDELAVILRGLREIVLLVVQLGEAFVDAGEVHGVGALPSSRVPCGDILLERRDGFVVLTREVVCLTQRGVDADWTCDRLAVVRRVR